ncbi:MAG: hypothetical protein DMF60_16425, partial [Acidobacteria bacterium]
MIEHRSRAARFVLFNSLAIKILFCCALCLASCTRTSGKAVDSSSPRPISVRVLPVEQKQIRRNVESVGSLFPLDEVTVSSEVEGRVEQVVVDVGDHVSAGQTIVKVVPTELQLTLDQQRASLQQARARLGLSDKGEDFKDASGAAEVKKAAADLADAKQKYLRAKTLLEQGLLPKQSFDEAD